MGMGPVEADSAVCMRTAVGMTVAVGTNIAEDMDVAVYLSIVEHLSVAVSRIQGWDLSRAGNSLCNVVQLSTVVGAGTAWDEADAAVDMPSRLDTTALSQNY